MKISLVHKISRLIAGASLVTQYAVVAGDADVAGVTTGVCKKLISGFASFLQRRGAVLLGCLFSVVSLSASALTTSDFSNTGYISSSLEQYEANTSNNSSTVVVLPKGLTLTKLADATAMSTPTAAGDVISYNISLENTGLLSLSAITLVDSIIPAAGLSLQSGDDGNGLLDADEVWLYHGSYTVTQEDIDSNGGGDGDIDNTVTVSTTEVQSQSASAAVEITQAPAFTVTKAVDKASIAAPGQLNYTIKVENTGNQTLNGISLNDTLPDGATALLGGPLTDSGISDALDVGEVWTYTGTYPASQSDIDVGAPLVNTVRVLANETGSLEKSASAQTVVVSEPQLSIKKSVDQATVAAPTQLQYQIELVNTGNLSLNNIILTDILPDGSTAILSGPAGDTGIADVLDVAETWLFTGSYQVVQDDIDAGVDLVNSVQAIADEITQPVATTATTQITSEPDMVVAKSVDKASINAPDSLAYLIEVTNTGNVTLTDLSVIDTLPDGANAVLIGPLSDSGAVGSLDVGESWQYTTSYAVSQSEIDDGAIRTNSVVVTATETAADEFVATALTTIIQQPGLKVSKSVDKTVITSPGTLNYTITAENTGNVSLGNVVITDILPDGSNANLTAPLNDIGAAGRIDVAESWTWTSTFAAEQSDIDAGELLINQVTISSDETGAQTDTAQTSVGQTPAIAIEKSSSTESFVAAGDVIDYQLLVSNTGNVLLSNLEITDPNADAASLQCTPAVSQLLPGETVSCTAIHTVGDDDIADTSVINQAFVTSLAPEGAAVEAGSNIVTVEMDPFAPVASDNTFVSPDSAVAVQLAAAQDDEDANGDLLTSSVNIVHADAIDTDSDGDADQLTVVGEGVWQADPTTGVVTFTPQSGFTADPAPIIYTVSDATSLISNGALLTIDYPQTLPVAVDDVKSNPDTPSPQNPTTLNVLADNGNGADTDPENDIDTDSVALVHADAADTDADGDADTLLIEGQGIWVVAGTGGDVTFTPLAGFLGDPDPVLYQIRDITGLTSNVASITIDYPQNAPVVVDDEILDQMLGQSVTVAVLANDSDPENNIDVTTLALIDPELNEFVTELEVAGEGSWAVNPDNGDVSFTPAASFRGSPEPVQYVVTDTTGLTSNIAVVTITYEEPARLAGTVWLDANGNGEVDANESRKSDWTLRIFNSDGVEVASVVTDANGEYSVGGLIPGVFTVEFYNENDVFMDSQTTGDPLVAGQTINLPLPVDPSGVVYDSLTRLPVSGVTLRLVDFSGNPISDQCLAENQQGQTTTEDGLYAFDLIPGAHSSCPSSNVYSIELAAVPDDYHHDWSSIIPEQGNASCGDAELACAVSGVFNSASLESECTFDSLPGTGACEVQSNPAPPLGQEDTRYYTEFNISVGDRNVVFNHLPLDARINDAEILLSKSSNRRQVSAGGVLQYTLVAENLKEVAAIAASVIDTPPAGFTLAPGSVRLQRVGDDLEFGTVDDVFVELGVTAAVSSPQESGGQATPGRALQFASIDLDALETIRISYLMRVGTGVVAGRHSNRAYVRDSRGIVSNEVSADVEIIADPVLDQATVIGKVFNDRDADGIQDPADATRVLLQSDFYSEGGLALPDLKGRRSINDDPVNHSVTVNMPLAGAGRTRVFSIQSHEGTRITVDAEGTITEAHVGLKARGLNAQDLRVCTRLAQAWPTDKEGFADNSQGEQSVLEITISNHGISERGLPGVRLATVGGLIIETDAYGRFHIPDVDTGSAGFGQNFILKVDPASLPHGARFTTENPYVLRIINDSLNRMNFGVQVDHARKDRYAAGSTSCTQGGDSVAIHEASIEVNLGSVFFDSNSAAVRENQRGIVDDILAKLQQYGGGVIVIEAHTDASGAAEYNLQLAEKRADALRDLIRESLGEALMQSVQVEVDQQALQESSR